MTHSVRSMLSPAIALALAAFALVLPAAPARALEKIPLTLAWVIGGSNGPLFLAMDRGYFAAEGLEIEWVPGDGSANVVNRLASGAYQIGFGDIASLIKFNTLNPDKKVMALYNQFPADLSIVSLKGRGITEPADLKGKTVGAPTGDTAYKMFAAFAAKNNLSDSDIKWEHMAITLREPMLIQGKVDAITANESTAYFALKGAGIADADMVFIRYPQHGVNLIGSGLMANESYIKEHPDVIRKIVKAFNRGWEDTFANPQASLDAALQLDARPSHALREALEHSDRVDDLFLERAVIHVSDRLSLLASLESFSEVFMPDENAVLALLGNLLHRYRYVFVDLPTTIAPRMIRVLHLPSTCLLVSDGSLVSARDVARWRENIGPNSPERSTLHVLNKSGADGSLPDAEFIRAAGQAPDIVIKYDREIGTASNLGVRGVQKCASLQTGLAPIYRLLAGERLIEERSWLKRIFG